MRRRLAHAAAAVFAAIGGCALAYVALVVVDARVYEAQARARLALAVASAPPPASPPRREGDLLGEIHSARIGLRAVIAEGDSPAVLRRAVGHVADTPAPGESGNVALAAHRDTLFRPLRHVQVGDVITVTTGGREVHYEVEWTAVVAPDALEVLEPTDGHALTLITCHPFSFVGAAPNRFVVRARARHAAGAVPSLLAREEGR
jgi:sortase A